MSRKNNETRIRILKTTWALLENAHGSAVRMVDIAKAAGLSRQAVYLHFPTRSELLVATTKYLDEVNHVDARLAASRSATGGLARLDGFVEVWGNYIPEIYGVEKALRDMKNTDEAARVAWEERMLAVRHGCEAVIKALESNNILVIDYTTKQAADILSATLSVGNWEQYRLECGWSQQEYISVMKRMSKRTLVKM